MPELSEEFHHLATEVHALHVQLRTDADERRNTREDEEILMGLLWKSYRIARRLSKLDSATKQPTQPKQYA